MIELRTATESKKSVLFEPKTTPSILATIPECLRNTLEEIIAKSKRQRKSLLISSNSLANKFILQRWEIRPSQRRRYRNLFSKVRNQCRAVFHHYLTRGRIEWDSDHDRYVCGVFKYDEIRGNLILGFVIMDPKSGWTLPAR